MPVQIPNHSHCVICTRACDFGDKTCSPECAQKLTDLQKKRRRNVLFLYGAMALLAAIYLWAISRGA